MLTTYRSADENVLHPPPRRCFPGSPAPAPVHLQEKVVYEHMNASWVQQH